MFPDAPASSDKLLSPVATVELNRILPAPVFVSISTAPPNVTPRVNVTLSLLVSMSPEVVSVPDLFAPNVTAPPALISPAAAMVVTPNASISNVLPDAAALIPIVPPESMFTAPAEVKAPPSVTDVVAS